MKEEGTFLIRKRQYFWMGLLLISLLWINGCTGRPFLTQDNSYSIHMIPSAGEEQKIPIQLSWDDNAAVMQKLLLEASFVLSDLKTELDDEAKTLKHGASDSTNDPHKSGIEPIRFETESQNTINLVANFPQVKQFNLVIDKEPIILDISSLEIEVNGKHPGRVVINQTLVLQGIYNPNLQPAYAEFIKMYESQSIPPSSSEKAKEKSAF